MIELSNFIGLFDPNFWGFLLGFALPLGFVYTRGGGGGDDANSTANRLARSTGSAFVDSLLSDDGTNVTLVSGQFIYPNGSKTVPSLRGADADSGIFFDTAGQDITITRNGIVTSILGGNVTLVLNGEIIFYDNNDISIGSIQSRLMSEAAAILQQGADSATPIAQTYKGPDGSGTDIAGGHMTLAPGRGTGTGVGGIFTVATAPAGATGSTQNALVGRLTIDSTGAGSITSLTVSSLTGAAGYRGIATMNSGTAVVSVAATAAISGAVILTQILQYTSDLSSQSGITTAVQSVRAGAFEIVAVGSQAPVASMPVAWFIIR